MLTLIGQQVNLRQEHLDAATAHPHRQRRRADSGCGDRHSFKLLMVASVEPLMRATETPLVAVLDLGCQSWRPGWLGAS